MILNTKTILEEVTISTKTKNPNPLVLKEQRLLQESIEKEDKIQSQVAMIFKDTKYYKPFQEAVITIPITTTPENETDEQKKKRLEEEKKEKQDDKILKHQTIRAIGAPIGSSLGYAIGQEAIKTGVGLATKSISALGKATGYWS
jgi:hypothetical protein